MSDNRKSIFLKKYVLNPVEVTACYVLFLTSLLFYTDSFSCFFNPCYFILLCEFIFLRLTDDFFDFEKDKLNGRNVFEKKHIILLLIIFSCVAFSFSIYFKRFIFIPLLIYIFAVYLFNLSFLKFTVVPLSFAFIIHYEFSFSIFNIPFFILCTGTCIVFGLLKKDSVYKEKYSIDETGGKAYNLWKLRIKNTPAFYPVKSCWLNPPDLEKLKLIVEMFCRKNKLYAVRSSAVDEDSDENSFAGVHDTFLNVKKEDVLEKILAVAESAKSEDALKYRKDKNLDCSDIKISVLIQEMVDADFAGVLNTINPVTNNFSETVISVTKGLGDKLVDGTVDGTTYFIDSGKKEIKGEDILNEKILKKILKLADELRKKTNRFQDCEFAVRKNKVYFLQSRAVTTYDFDSHGMTLLIDNSNLIESYYGMTSELTHSFAHEIYSKVYTETCKTAKINKRIMKSLKTSLDNMLYSFEGKLYYNLNSWYNLTSIVPSKNSASYMESMMGVKTRSRDFKKAKLTLFDITETGIILLSKLKDIDRLSDIFVKNFNEIVNPYYAKNLDNLSTSELIKLYEQIDSKIIKEFTTPILNDIGVMMNFGRLKEKVKKYDNADELLAFAVNSNGNVESARNASEFVKILNFIRQDSALQNDFTELSESELYEKYYEEKNPLSEMIKKYIYSYGARVMNELKLETVTMIEKPSMIFSLIKDGLKNKTAPNSERKDIVIPRKLRKLSSKARHFIQNRERLRLRRTYVFSVIRNIFLSLGKNLEKEGKIENYRDVFYLRKNEIFYPEQDFNYRKKIEERKNLEKINSQKTYYSRIAFFGDKVLPVSFISRKGLKGIPSGNGIIKAKVCIMENRDSNFILGSIIVTARTDPGWISLFPLAAGLIVEHGSMLSHSFVVAREMHLPCIVGAEGVMQKLKTGDVVTLDAQKGEITIEAV